MPKHNIQEELERGEFTSGTANGMFPTPEGYLVGWGSTLPTAVLDSGVGMAPGSIFFKTSGGSEAPNKNTGTAAAPTWSAL